MHFVLARKNGFKSEFSPFLLSERKMVINYFYNFLEHENSLLTKVTEYLCSGWFFFLQTNFDFLTSHF